MRFDNVVNTLYLCLCLFLLLVSGLIVIPEAAGELTLEAGLKGTYEDNITGSSADVAKGGDFYTTLFFSADGSTEVSDKTYLFLRGDAGRFIYNKYDDLNAYIFGLSAGAAKEFNDVVALLVALNGRVKSYRDNERDSNSYGAYLEAKQQLAQKLWIRESYEYEKNKANLGVYSYKGNSFSAWFGYHYSPQTMLNLGYNYLVRSYENPAGYKSTSHTTWAAMKSELAQKLYLNVGYSRQFNDSNLPNTDNTNNIYNIGLTYAF